MKFPTVKFRKFVDEIMANFPRSKGAMSGPSEVIENTSLIPASAQDAHTRLKNLLDQSAGIKEIGHDEFMKGWIAIFHVAPALNPDEATTEEGGWPVSWRQIAIEAFRRFEKKELTKEELYPRLDRLM